MMYLSPKKKILDLYKADKTVWGILISPFNSQGSLGDYKWAGDNGAFNNKYSEDVFFAWLQKQTPYNCLFIVCPDKLCDATSTLEMYKRNYNPIKQLGFPVAFVVQDGQEDYEIPPCDYLFLGGSTTYKLSNTAMDVIRSFNGPVHVGRVNSVKRMNRFYWVDTVDGTTLAYAPTQRFMEINSWLHTPQHRFT